MEWKPKAATFITKVSNAEHCHIDSKWARYWLWRLQNTRVVLDWMSRKFYDIDGHLGKLFLRSKLLSEEERERRRRHWRCQLWGTGSCFLWTSNNFIFKRWLKMQDLNWSPAPQSETIQETRKQLDLKGRKWRELDYHSCFQPRRWSSSLESVFFCIFYFLHIHIGQINTWRSAG